MAAQHSPALPPMRPGLLDPSRQAEYPILLGKSFRENRTVAGNHLLNVRYNWKSKQIPQRQVITEVGASLNSYTLVGGEGNSEPYKYGGTLDPKSPDADSAHLALIFDKEKSAFVLESIFRSLNFNLTSATTKPNIDQLPQLETIKNTTKNASQRDNQDGFRDDDGDVADTENPYDYRHFLAEAIKDAEAGETTPKPSGTVMASPIPTATKILTTNKSITPLESPFMVSSKRRKIDSKSGSRGTTRTTQPAANAPKAKSRSIAATSRSRVGYHSAGKTASSDEGKKKARAIHGKQAHSRDKSTSQAYATSPQIIVDEASDLTIDMGSPPAKAKTKHRVNHDAFASHSRGQSRANTASVSPQGKERGDSDRDAEGGVRMNNDGDDDDVEDLALPSPRETRKASSNVSRITQDRPIEDDDEDDGLAAELEAVFDQEDDGDNETVGLGISGSQDHGTVNHDEESEVSEEE